MSRSSARLRQEIPGSRHDPIDIRDLAAPPGLVKEIRPDVIVHTAAQPSHNRTAAIPFPDFEVTPLATMKCNREGRKYRIFGYTDRQAVEENRNAGSISYHGAR